MRLKELLLLPLPTPCAKVRYTENHAQQTELSACFCPSMISFLKGILFPLYGTRNLKGGSPPSGTALSISGTPSFSGVDHRGRGKRRKGAIEKAADPEQGRANP